MEIFGYEFGNIFNIVKFKEITVPAKNRGQMQGLANSDGQKDRQGQELRGYASKNRVRCCKCNKT